MNGTCIVVQDGNPASLHAFALSQVYVYFGICVVTVALTKSFKRYRDHPAFKFYFSAKHRLRRNVVSYVLELLVTTVIFFVYAIVGFPLLTIDPYTSMIPHQYSIDLIVFFGIWLVALYLWELSAKLEMNWQLALHHTITLALVCACAYQLYTTRAWCNVFGLVIMVQTAVTEQPTFVALLLYRMELYVHARNCFYVGGVSSILFKTACLGAMIPVYINDIYGVRDTYNTTFWIYALWPLLVVLYFSQMYGAYILFQLARVSHRKAFPTKRDIEVEEQDQAQERAPPTLTIESAPPHQQSWAMKDITLSSFSSGLIESELDVGRHVRNPVTGKLAPRLSFSSSASLSPRGMSSEGSLGSEHKPLPEGSRSGDFKPLPEGSRSGDFSSQGTSPSDQVWESSAIELFPATQPVPVPMLNVPAGEGRPMPSHPSPRTVRQLAESAFETGALQSELDFVKKPKKDSHMSGEH